MKDLDVITNRIRTVEQEIAKAKSRLKTLQEELVELHTAGRVFSRLTSARWAESPPTTDEVKAYIHEGFTKPTTMTVPELIIDVLLDADRQGQPNMTPKMITDRLVERHGTQPAGQNVNSVAWRMWKQGRLDKVGSAYSVRKSDSSASQVAVGSGLADEEATVQDREAGPGGGT